MRDLGAILVAEHDFADAFLLNQALFKAGVNVPVNFVSDGQQAIDYFKGQPPYDQRAEHPVPDLLLLNLAMPHVDGFEVLSWLRRQPDLAQVSVVVLTESGHTTVAEEAMALGASFVIVKPHSCGQMACELGRVVEVCRSEIKLKTGPNRGINGHEAVPWNVHPLNPQLQAQLPENKSLVPSLPENRSLVPSCVLAASA